MKLLEEYTPEELRANGGRLLATLALREIANDDYHEYLRTWHWRNVRQQAFKVYGRRCTIGVNCHGSLQVHHRTYDSLGDELMEHIEVLCDLHHKMKHDAEQAFVRDMLRRQFTPPPDTDENPHN